MKPLTAVILLGTGAFLISKAAKATVIERLSFFIGNVKMTSFGLSPELTVTVLVQNVTNEKFTVKSLVGNAFVNDMQVGNVSSFTQLVALPSSETPYLLTVRISLLQAVTQIIDILKGNAGVEATVRIVGTVNVDNLLFPIDMEYKII